MCDCEKNWHVGFLDEALENVDNLAAYYAQEGDGERSEEEHTFETRIRNWDGKGEPTHNLDWGSPVGKEV